MNKKSFFMVLSLRVKRTGVEEHCWADVDKLALCGKDIFFEITCDLIELGFIFTV